ncbi:helix-turn-helix domain-containing protein [Pseudofulvibacter geojedonensis]|uniref:Helix-turn-helix domain-containing protein n=1 Tax=Pseudofulvibacter geojedonensis TaxID=1123758 RepID=A0ABW3I4G4_9FLAO
MNNESFGLSSNIVHYRKKLGLSQEALAERANVSLSTVQRIEKGTVKPRAYTIRILAESLGIEIIDLLPDLENKKDSNIDFLALKKMNFYALVLVFIPFINIILPLLVWKKNKKTLTKNIIAGKIISFQLLWSISVIVGAFSCIILTNLITGEAGFGHYTANTFFLVALIYNVFTIVKTASQLNKKDENVLAFVTNLF